MLAFLEHSCWGKINESPTHSRGRTTEVEPKAVFSWKPSLRLCSAQGHTASYRWNWAWLRCNDHLKYLLNISQSDHKYPSNLLPLEFTQIFNITMSLNFQSRGPSGFHSEWTRERTECKILKRSLIQDSMFICYQKQSEHYPILKLPFPFETTLASIITSYNTVMLW